MLDDQGTELLVTGQYYFAKVKEWDLRIHEFLLQEGERILGIKARTSEYGNALYYDLQFVIGRDPKQKYETKRWAEIKP